MTQKEWLEKMAKFCAYQERCQFDVRKKLFGTELSEDEKENIICELISMNFLDEERFSKAFVRGKFYQKKWGRVKIKQHLKQRQISEYCIKKGFQEIKDTDYFDTIDQLVAKKEKTLTEENSYKHRQKIAQFLLSKGYENEIVWEILNLS